MSKPCNSKRSAKKGFTLSEVLVTMIIAGLSAALLAPRIVESGEAQRDSLMVERVNLAQQQLSLTFSNYKIRNNLDNDDLESALHALPVEAVKYEDIFFFNGNFFAFKAEGASGVYKYFYFSDKSRMSFNPDFYRQGDYTNLSLSDPVKGACDSGIANANRYSCAFLDTNGKQGPNSLSRTGDIIPLIIDTNNFSVTTLYKATNNAAYCSKYDVLVNGC